MEEHRNQRRLAAILAADMVGYSRLMEADEAGTAARQKAYRTELIDPAIADYGGRIVKTTGDGLLVEFPSVVDAVACAVTVQRAMAMREAKVAEDKRIAYRVGINLGDVMIDGDDILGDGVNVAARLEGLAEPGGICISGTAYDQLKAKVDVGYAYLGEQTVKNIAEPVRVYRVLLAEEAAGQLIDEARPPPRRAAWLAAAALAAVVALAAAAYWLQPWAPDVEPASVARMAFPLPDKPSIAVLAFDNLSGDPKNDFLSDGISEDITSALSQTPKIFVIARNSAFTYKGKPVRVQQVAEELGVRYVLEGSVQRSAERVRITAQLIDALKGHHMWAGTYDREFTDVFELQDEITRKVVEALQVKLIYGEQAGLWRSRTTSSDAYELVLKARSAIFQYTQDNNIKARELAQRAIEIDPNYLLAYYTLAWTYLIERWYGWTKDPDEALRRAAEFADKVLAIDDTYGPAHTISAGVHLERLQHDAAVVAAEKAVTLSPGDGNEVSNAGWILKYAGRYERALELMQRGLRLDPLAPLARHDQLASAYWLTGRYDEMFAVDEKIVSRPLTSPRYIITHLRHAAVRWERGEQEAARQIVSKVLKSFPTTSVSSMTKDRSLSWYKDRGVAQKLVNTWRKIGLPENPPLKLPDKPSIAVLPFTNMSDDPKQEYFADGMAEDIITDLSRISGLFVIARHSSFSYRGKQVDVRTIAQELGVKYVLEGSVRKAGGQVRINAQLVDALSGGHVWAERFDGDLANIFAFQDRVSERVVDALKVSLTPEERSRVERKPTANMEAYEYYLQARKGYQTYLWKKFKEVLSLYEKAIKLDPRFAEAYAGVAEAAELILYNSWFWVLPPTHALDRAKQSAARALALDPDNAMAHRVLAAIELHRSHHAEAIRLAEQAVTLDPNGAEWRIHLASVLVTSGEHLAAAAALETAMRLEPRPTPHLKVYIGWTQMHLRQYENAIATFSKARKEQPELNVVWVSLPLAVSYAYLGQLDKAAAEVERARKAWPAVNYFYYRPFLGHYRRKEDIEHFIDGLRRAGVPQWPHGFEGREEDRLTGAEIKTLFYGHRATGSDRFRGAEFEREIADDGSFIWRSSGLTMSGENSVEGDLICMRAAELMRGRRICMPIYRNPAGTNEQHNEYISPHHYDISEFSVVE